MAERVSDTLKRELRAAVGTDPRHRKATGGARDVDYRSRPPLAHVRKNGPHESVGAEEVHVEIRPDVFYRNVFDRTELAVGSVID